MRHHIFEEAKEYPIALLIKNTSFNTQSLINNYILPLESLGVPRNKIIAFTLEYENDKAPAKLQKEYLDKLLIGLKTLGVKYLYCCDGNYFKTLTKQNKADPHLGYVLPCAVKGFEDMKVILNINFRAVMHNPAVEPKITLGNTTLANEWLGNYQPIGSNIIHNATYALTYAEVQDGIKKLNSYPVIACDIETFGLTLQEAGIATIAFAWSKHEGLAFPVDYIDLTDFSQEPVDVQGNYGTRFRSSIVRKYLKLFFANYKGTIIWHGSTFDLRVLIFELFMDSDPLNRVGMLLGLDIMTRRIHDTKILSYLATNSTAGNELGLKKQAHEFAGNWAKDDIENALTIPLKELLQYNLVDTLATMYLYEKHFPTIINDNQLNIYNEIMLPSLKVIIQCELVGMPLHAETVQETKKELLKIQDEVLAVINSNPCIAQLNLHLQTQAMNAANAKLKTKQHPLSKFADVVFNPNSNPQLQYLLYEMFGLPVIDLTDKRQPATGGDTLEKLIHHTDDPDQVAFLKAMISYIKVDKIITSFIPSFEAAFKKADGMSYLHGNFNLGGTVSGRLSSSKPNLQQIPSNSTYAKLIKKCFQAPKGWLMVGADFNALEDRINALLTKDPNKIKVFTEGYDSHCLRAFYYFPEQMPTIVETPESVNSIAVIHKDLRQDSKSPSFALQYKGTWRTMVRNLGWPEEKAKRIEERFHKLYAVSAQWTDTRIEQASKDGYAEAAFGLRIRTPILGQTILGASGALKEAGGEARTLGNAISGQSYGLLTNRALNAFMQKVWNSPYALKILPIAMIHDAIYLLVENDLEVLRWVNTELIHEMQWQELPEIRHDEVKLGAELDVFYPSWAEKFTIPNHAGKEDILHLAKEHFQKVSK